MLDQLGEHDRLPESLAAEQRGVDLQSPVGGKAPQNDGDLTIDDFAIDEQSDVVERCPNGCEPQASVHDEKTHATTTVMRSADCRGCAFRSQCPVKKSGGRFVLRHTPAQRRLAVILRCAGWNIFRALTSLKKRGIRDVAALAAAFSRRFGDLRSFETARRRPYAAKIIFYA